MTHKRFFGFRWLTVTFALGFALVLISSEVWARAGGGRSGGFRGSRPYSAPRTTSPSPTSPGAPSSGFANRTNPLSQATRSPFLTGLAGGLAGGFLGSLLFGGMGHGAMGAGGGGGGIGFLEILLLALGAYLLFRFIRGRKKNAPPAAYQGNDTPPPYSQAAFNAPAQSPGQSPGQEVEAGLSHIQSMDARFDPAAFKDWVQDLFFKIQASWENQDLGPVLPFLGPEIKELFSRDLGEQQARGQVNRLENIAVRSVDITEAWQEEGKDFITVFFYANLLDFVEDRKTGAIVSGSKVEPVKFREFWTFVRPVGGGNTWQLSAIQQEG
ncbi:MAG: Tim44 domain-containing protein [Deltaproteobacteria bacterium]|nr:Tim44 domain-containing protein [Deltaproteobacteria bacterium]